MKIIDDKGKLFGKLNIIDLFVLIVVAVVVIFLGVRLIGNGNLLSSNVSDSSNIDSTNPTKSASYIRFTVLCTGAYAPSYDTVKQFVDAEKGLKDQLMANDSLLNGYVVDVEATPHISYVANPEDGTVKAVPSTGEDNRIDMTFTCVAAVSNTVTNQVGTQHIRAGISHILKTTHFEFAGSKVLTVEWLDEAPF